MTEKERFGRNKLLEAMRVSEKSYCDQFSPAEGEIRYTDDYLRDMEKILQKSKKPIRRYFNFFGKRVAGIVAAILIIFGCSMTVSAVREPVVEFLTNIYEKFIEIVFGDEDVAKAPDSIETVYTLGFVPEGYEMESFLVENSLTKITWKNENGNKIILSQIVLKGFCTLDGEESDYVIFEQHEKSLAYVHKYEYKIFYWNSEAYNFQLIVPCDMSQEEALALIDSITKYNP